MIKSLGLIYFGFALTGLIMIFKGPLSEEKKQRASEFADRGFMQEESKTSSSIPAQYQKIGVDDELMNLSVVEAKVSIWSLIFSKQFMLLYLMNSLSILTGLFAINNSKSFGQANGYKNENYLALLGSLASIFNSLRFIWSSGTDYLSYKRVYAVMLLL